MNTPSGYTALDLIGFTDRGAYDSTANYVKNDLTHDLSNKIWRCLIDDTHGVAPVEGVNWTLFIDSQTALSGMSDVQITTPATGEALVYDGTASKWKNELLADVALSGDYVDLNNLPTLGTAAAKDSTNAVTQGSTDLVESGAVYSGLADKVNTSDVGTAAEKDSTSSITQGSTDLIEAGAVYSALSGKADTLSLGTAAAKDSTNAVTQNSTDLVESGAVYTEVNSVKTAFANQVNVADAKNLYTFETYSQTLNSVAFTVNDDLSISTANTSGSGSTVLKVGTLAKGLTNVHLSGCPSGGSQNAWCLQLYDATINDYLSAETGDGRDYSLDATHEYQIRIVIRASQNMSGKTFKPMITLLTTPDSDYEHYASPAKTNRQLTEDSVTWTDEAQIGAVNFLDSDAATQVVNGATYTNNGNGTYTVVAGSSTTYSSSVLSTKTVKLPKGTYRWTASADGKSPIGSNDCYAFIKGINGTSNWYRSYQEVYGYGVFTLTQESTIQLGICCASGVTIPSITFYPMITPVSYNGPYVPHAKTNRELTDDVDTIENLTISVKVNTITTYTTMTYCLKKVGIVDMNWVVTDELTANQTVKVGQLPEGSRPYLKFYETLTQNGIAKGYGEIRTDGGIYFTPSTTGQYYGIRCSFIAAN